MIPASVDPCLETFMKTSPGPAVLVLADGDVALAVGHPEGERARTPPARQTLPDGADDDRLGLALLLVDEGVLELGDPLRRAPGRGPRRRIPEEPRRRSTTSSFGRRERLGHLAVVAVDGDRLEPEPPGVDVQLLDVLDGHVLGHVDGLGDRPADERLHRAHHPDVAGVVDRVVPHRAGEHRQVLRLSGAAHRRSSCARRCRRRSRRSARVVAELCERPRDRLVDDRHRPATDELLRLHEPEVGLDAGGVAVHEQADGPGRGEHARLGVAHAVAARRARPPRPTPPGPRRAAPAARAPRRSSPPPPGACAARRASASAFSWNPANGPIRARDASRGGVGVAGHERGDRPRPGPALVGVVGQAVGHQQRAEVGVADAELAEAPGVLGDLLGRVVGVADEDLLGGEDDLDRGLEALDVERVVVVRGTSAG